MRAAYCEFPGLVALTVQIPAVRKVSVAPDTLQPAVPTEVTTNLMAPVFDPPDAVSVNVLSGLGANAGVDEEVNESGDWLAKLIVIVVADEVCVPFVAVTTHIPALAKLRTLCPWSVQPAVLPTPEME